MFGVQWLHILLGILWFGNSLVLVAIIIPAINRLPILRLPILAQREIGAHIGDRGQRVIEIVAPAVIVLGIIRGTLLARSRIWMRCWAPPTD